MTRTFSFLVKASACVLHPKKLSFSTTQALILKLNINVEKTGKKAWEYYVVVE